MTIPQQLRRGLVGYWPIAPGSSGAISAADAQAKLYQGAGPNDITSVNSPVRGAGPSNNLPDATDFDDASSQHLEVADATGLSVGARPFTIACWVLADDFSANHGLISKDGISAGTREFILFWLTNGTLRWDVYDSSDSGTTVGSSVLSTGTWYFVVVGWDGGRTSIQVNAEAPGTKAASGARGSGTSKFAIGARWREDISAADLYHDGRIAHVGYWARPLSDAEVQWLYNGGGGRDLLRGA